MFDWSYCLKPQMRILVEKKTDELFVFGWKRNDKNIDSNILRKLYIKQIYSYKQCSCMCSLIMTFLSVIVAR